MQSTADVMNGFPPEPDARATLANWRTSPYCRWAFHHVREIVPSAEIANDPSSVWELEATTPVAKRAIDDAVNGMSNDALVVLHNGRIAHESYRNGMTAHDPHILMSVSKSVLGLLAGTLVERGEIALEGLLVDVLPELSGTAYAGATFRDALDMRVGVLFDEDYEATSGPIIEYRKAANWNPLAPGESALDLRAFQGLLTEADGPHSGRFHYVSPVTDMLAWAFERASGIRYADLLSDRLLKPMGAERPGYITVDRIGGARAAGGVCLTARDLARIGQLMLHRGARDGRQVIPESWVEDIWAGGDRAAWEAGDFNDRLTGRNMSYRSKWYRGDAGGVMLYCMGIHGQFLFVDHERALVIAWFSSEHDPTSPDWAGHVIQSVDQIRAALG